MGERDLIVVVLLISGLGAACAPEPSTYRSPSSDAASSYMDVEAECARYPERCEETYDMLTGEALDRQIGDPYEFDPGAASAECPLGCDTHKIGCDIKGNISFDTSEKIYHVPGDEFYAATTISPEYGERWFCTEAEAAANGWRRTYSR